MANFAYYGDDGADLSSRAVLALTQALSCRLEDINQKEHSVQVARWSNFREQGYVLTIKPYYYHAGKPKQLNIAWFQHRNSDDICVIVWKQDTLDAPSIHDADFGDIYKDKYDVTASFRYNEHYKVAEFIVNQMNSYIELAEEKRADEYEIVR